jgi:CubicO group peptidase (beta-lactamase class C family)
MNGTRTKVFIPLILIVLLAGCATSSPVPASSSPTPSSSTYWPTNGWRSTTPEEQGMDSEKLAQMVEELKQGNLDLNSLLIVRNGNLVTELYISPYSAGQADFVYSVTKSVIGTLVGIAIQKGNIKDVQQPLISLLSDQGVKNLDENKKAITLENLLTQTSGLKCPDTPEPGETVMEASENWVQFMLDQPIVSQPGTKFNYCTSATHLVSAILQKATGMSVVEFANQNLFLPLGIGPITKDRWPSDPQGVTIGGYGLVLTPSEMAKLGYLYLNHGEWDGKAIIPADWVGASTTKHANQENKKDYGYLWWVDNHGQWYAALGRSGHHIFVYPDKNLVVVFTASLPFTNDADLIPLQELLDQYILPSIKSDHPLPANPNSLTRLEAGLQTLAQPARTDPSPLPAIAAEISGKTYTLANNPSGWQTMIFSFEDGSDEAKVTINGARQLAIGLDNTYRIFGVDDPTFPEALRGRWENQDTLVVEDVKLGQLSKIIIRIQFSDDTILITGQEKYSGSQFEMNGSLNQ